MTWDLTEYFPSFEHPDRAKFHADLKGDLDVLVARAQALPELASDCFEEWTDLVLSFENWGTRIGHLDSYVGALASADSSDTTVRAVEADLARLDAREESFSAELRRACSCRDASVFEAWLQSPELQGAEYFLRRVREQAARRMPKEQESLAAALGVDGIGGWGRLYNQLTSRLSFDMPQPDGSTKSLPVSARRSLLESRDRSVRRAAFEAGSAAYESIGETLAAALNHMTGTRLTLQARRGEEDELSAPLFQGAMSRKALFAMYEAVERQIDLPRRVLRLKARLEGRETVAWYDMGAPFAVEAPSSVSFDEATSWVGDAFARTYPALAEFFEDVIQKRWVDWELRPAKRSGAFCTSSAWIEQSRVFMNFGGTIGDVSTLAHEVGHAFHAKVLSGSRYAARRYPMTLAETASTFAESILARGAMESGDEARASAFNAHMLNDVPVFLLDITVRFRFERALCERRRAGELSLQELKDLMAETQATVLGDVLAADGADPWFWAWKLHFFLTGISFYNFPYTFGYLLSRGLFTEFERQGSAFLPRYESFLARSGQCDAVTLARETLGCDLETPEFWERAIVGLGEPLEQLESALLSSR